MSANSVSLKDLSQFARAAVELDGDFKLLQQLAGEIDHASVETDKGLERAKDLLEKFGACGERITAGVQSFAQGLEEMRVEGQRASDLVTARVGVIRERQRLHEEMLERFRSLGEMVRQINSSVATLKKPDGETIEDQDRATLAEQMPKINSGLEMLIEKIVTFKNDARAAKMRELERNADSLSQKLMSARKRLETVVQPANLA